MSRSDPKPAARVKDKKVRPSGAQCVATGITDTLHAHHLISRAQGGDDVPENMVWVELFTHDRFHAGSPSQRYEAGHAIRKGLSVEHIDYIVKHRRGGWEWLDQKYPAEPW